MPDKVIPLSRKYPGFGDGFDKVVLREPKYPDFIAIGDVQEMQPVPGGGVAIVTYNDRISAYVDRLLQFPEPAALAELDLADSIKVVEEIAGFFTIARRSLKPSTSFSSVPAKT